MSSHVTTVLIAVALLTTAAIASRWWAARPSRGRLLVAVAGGTTVAVACWITVAAVGSAPGDGTGAGLALLLLTLAVGGVLEGRRRLQA